MAKISKTISIEEQLWKRGQSAGWDNNTNLSYILSSLLEQWLEGKIDLTITNEPLKEDRLK